MKRLLLYVFGAHALIVCALLVSHFFYKEPPRKKIVVHTFKQRETPKIAQAPKPPLKKVVPKVAPKKAKANPPPKKGAPKEPPKKTEPKKPPQPTKNPPIVKAPPPPPKEDPAILEYGATLITFFQESLDLPEYGEVKMKIEIDSEGHIFKADVLSSESTGNEEFLKKRLPQLVCPCFNGGFDARNSFEFSIVFKNL